MKAQVSFEERMIPCPPDGRPKKMPALTIEALPDGELPPIRDGETYLLQSGGQDVLLIKVHHTEGKIIFPESMLVRSLISPHAAHICDMLPGGGNGI